MTTRRPGYDDGSRPDLLVLRALGLGDLLTAVPALRALRTAYPDHRLVLAAPARLADAAEATGLVDHLLPAAAPGRGVPASLDWTGPPPRLAVDLHGNGELSHRVLRALRPGRLLAYADPCLPDAPGPRWREDEHERARWCRLARWYGIPADPEDLLIPAPGAAATSGTRPPRTALPGTSLPGTATSDAIVLHPGADAEARRWPTERFTALAAESRSAGHRVHLTAGAGESERAHHIARRAGLPRGAVHAGPSAAVDLPFGELAALVASARAVVCGDTGVAHLASALATPSVVLFGPVSPRLWGPPEHPRHRVLWHHHPRDGAAVRPGDAHGDRIDPRLSRISVPDVLEALANVMEAPDSGTHAPAYGS